MSGRILVVDDDPMILMHACAILEDAGFRFYEAGTGDELRSLEAEVGALGREDSEVVGLFEEREPAEIRVREVERAAQ